MVLNTNIDLSAMMDIDFLNFDKNAFFQNVKNNEILAPYNEVTNHVISPRKFNTTATNDCSLLLCKSCLKNLTVYQIDFNEAFKICTNLECAQSLNLDLASCIIKRDLTSHRQSTEQSQSENENLDVILNNIIESRQKKIENILETSTTTTSEVGFVNDEIQPSNTEIITNNNNDFFPDFFDLVQSSDDLPNSNLDNTNVSLPSSPSNDDPLTASQLFNNELTNSTCATNDIDIDNNIVFDDNFLSSLDNLLTDCEPAIGANFVPDDPQSNNSENTVGFKSQLLNVSSGPNQSLNFTELKPISQAEFYSRFASDVYSNDFQDTNTFESFNQMTPTHNDKLPNLSVDSSPLKDHTVLVSHSKKNGSSITISKVVPKSERVTRNKTQKDDNILMKIENDPIEISIDQSKLKITDNKDEIVNLLSTQLTPKSASLKSKNTSQTTPKTTDNDTISLLEWEKSTKNIRKKLRLDTPALSVSQTNKLAEQSSSTPKSSTDFKNRLMLPISKSNLSISKSNLMSKSPIANQTTSKQSLLGNKSLLDSIKIELLPDVKDNNKGYKDLVLSVLKKKTANV